MTARHVVASSVMRISSLRVTIAGLLALLAYVAALSFPSSEAVRLRNALLLKPIEADASEWTPETAPADFKLDRGSPNTLFSRVAQEQAFAKEPSEWRRALMIARHVREPMVHLDPIFGDLTTTYRQIMRGHGYCADATDVFLALANAAGLSARQWGFSIDGYGGRGHAINEVYDHTLRQWVYLDVFFNYYLIDPQTERPLSALEVRSALQSKSFEARIVPIIASRPVDFDLDKRLRWFRRGSEHWFLWWGNNVVTLDERSSLGSLAQVMPSAFARAIEQLRGVALGAYPSMAVVKSPLNRNDIDSMLALRRRLLAVGTACVVLTGLLLAQIFAAVRKRRAARRHIAQRINGDGALVKAP